MIKLRNTLDEFKAAKTWEEKDALIKDINRREAILRKEKEKEKKREEEIEARKRLLDEEKRRKEFEKEAVKVRESLVGYFNKGVEYVTMVDTKETRKVDSKWVFDIYRGIKNDMYNYENPLFGNCLKGYFRLRILTSL